jgi:DNA-binding MarR family transcriptional regulator
MEHEELISETINNIRRLFHVVNEHSKKAEHETGITGPQLWAIKLIGDATSIRTVDLAKRMYLHPATVVGILDRLESQDLVNRVRSTDDRRVVNVKLKNRGLELLQKAPEVAQGLLVKGLEALSEKKLMRIYDGLKTLVEILGAQEIPPQLMFSDEVNKEKKRSRVKNQIPEPTVSHAGQT